MTSIEEPDIQPEPLPLVMNHLPDFYRKKAEVELNESTSTIIEGLQELRNLAKEHKSTCDINFEDDFLVQFLRHRKYDVSRALKQLVKFTNTRKSWSYLFRRIDFDKCFRYQSSKFFTALPRRCPDGCAIVLFELGKWEPEEFSLREFQTLGWALFIQSIRYTMTQVNGYKIIYDFTNTSFKHLKHFTPYNIYQFYHMILESLPARHKAMFVIFNSLTARVAWAIFKGFATPKLKSRTFLMPSPEDLLEHFPPSVLPVQYRGDLADYHTTEWLREANEQNDNFPMEGQKNYY